ncbi:MAG: hypothetical protein Q7W30_09235 [Coriobacteriia bacterium]|nr:hypothetical protein [Coriobacteriia bacterium]
MKKRQKRQIVALAVLLLLLALLGVWYVNFQATKSLVIDLRASDPDTVAPPVYLYSFAGTGTNRVQRPIGVLAFDGSVYVTDGQGGQVVQFRENGAFVRIIGKGKLKTPIYVARNPKDGNLYISDRRLRAVMIFTPDGRYVRTFDPALPKSELPKFDVGTDQWVPVAIGFAPDGTMYVTELLNGHRMLIFGPDGKFRRSVGTIGLAPKATEAPERFQFPNSVKVQKNEVWVVDSNNRRMQVFDLKGTFKRLMPVSGLPRGVAFLPAGALATSSTADKMVVVDVLSHDATIWNTAGKKLAVFGERGVLEGQFNFPNDVSIGSRSLIFITDTQNGRVQAWGWRQNLSPVPAVLPSNPTWCLAFLPLLLIPLLFRRKKFYATTDFIDAMILVDRVPAMARRRYRWLVSAETYEQFRDRSEGEVRFADLLEATEHSETDAAELVRRLDLEKDQARTLASAQRVKVFCTESAELRRLAKLLEIEVLNRDEYLERFGGGVAVKGE